MPQEPNRILSKMLERLFSAFGEMAGNSETPPSLWVSDSNFDKAGTTIEEFKRGTLAAHASSNWKCPRCGETIEGQFSSCWKCNTGRPKTE